ncbi:DUF6148 family protein [Pleomorphomonas sp. JP5]|uniref:DUF6148 family protein n=1 Tax=Pleomorphomonas sp. JP5 TaxID=2942998 RepID=UPI002043FF71|nr:DUF6148 family protein [Pleomorphomonas sp. JP5]MCM5560306.1 DUF6148 family protein [Pleomorphomonas sp. JP5]
MAGITLEQAETQLDLWMAASTAVASSQSYEIGGRKLTRADAATIRDNIEFWEAKVLKLTGGGRRGPRYGVSA